MWPGNTADVTTLLPVVDRLQRRFSIGRGCVVADRGMISAATIAGLEERKLDYILGARERTDAVLRKLVLENDDPFVPLLVERKAGETQLFVKQVKAEGVRYVVCRNEAEAENDRKDREAIVAALDAQLRKGDKALIGNSAYRRYLRKAGARGERSFEIDAGKLAEEARFDGIFVLRTNAKVTPLQAVLRYRDLLLVGAVDAEASRRPRPPSRPRAGMEGAVARSRPPATGAHPLPSRRLARAHRRRARCDQAFQMRPCRPAVPRPPGPSTAATPVQIRTKTPRPPKA